MPSDYSREDLAVQVSELHDLVRNGELEQGSGRGGNGVEGASSNGDPALDRRPRTG